MIEFDTKIRVVGNSYGITIPMDLIKCNVIDPNRKLRIKIEQKEKEKGSSESSITSEPSLEGCNNYGYPGSNPQLYINERNPFACI